jgi:hypothetical protein
MHLDDYVQRVQDQLTGAAALGDDRTREIAHTLSTTLDSAVRLVILDAVSDAAAEVTHALLTANSGGASPTVTATLDAGDIQVQLVAPQVEDADVLATSTGSRADDGEASARISLRLSESLKADVERAASAADVSVNTWLVRAATAALRPSGSGWMGSLLGDLPRGGHASPGGPGRPSNRITGWVIG